VTAHVEALTLDLPADSTAPRLARTAVGDRLGEHPRRDDLLLCVSELVTNAVIHAGTASQLRLRPSGDLLLVEVLDHARGMPTRREHDLQAVTGRGLHLLDALAADWGTRPHEGGKIVWFEFDLGGGRSVGDGATRDGEHPDGHAAVTAPPGAWTRIVVHGDLDLEQATPFRDELLRHVESGASHLLVDLADCPFLDSTGISLLVTTRVKLLADGGDLRVEHLHPQVAAVLALAGLDDMVT
jgi:anti-anti-sigma factor